MNFKLRRYNWYARCPYCRRFLRFTPGHPRRRCPHCRQMLFRFHERHLCAVLLYLAHEPDLSQRQVAEVLGTCRHAVQTWLMRAGVTKHQKRLARERPMHGRLFSSSVLHFLRELGLQPRLRYWTRLVQGVLAGELVFVENKARPRGCGTEGALAASSSPSGSLRAGRKKKRQ